MIIMAKTYCHEGYCESSYIENPYMDNNYKMMVGGYLLFAVALTVLVWYGVSIGIYPEITLS